MSTDRARANESINEVRRSNDVTDANRRKQYLAERSDVDDALLSVETLQCSQRLAQVTKLAVVIVLYDPCACLRGEAQQFESTAQRQSHSQRILVRRRYVDQTRIGATRDA